MLSHMLKTLILSAMASMLATSLAQAQIYRSVDAAGNIVYTDRPPVETTAPDEVATSMPAPMSQAASSLPYELQQTMARYPVVLYAQDNCAPCVSGRNLLLARGIPYAEKTVETNADIEALQQLTGRNDLPLLTIGQQHLTGYSEHAWVQYLTAAGYPETSQLPSNWQAPEATPLVLTAHASDAPADEDVDQSDADEDAALESEPSIAPEVTESNPIGIRF